MGSFSIWHWLIVLLVVLLIFGPKKLSEVGKGLGEGMKNFKKGLNEDDDAAPRAKDQSPPAIEASKGSKDDAESEKTKDNDRAAG